MQDVDKETIQKIGIPGLVLMERASEKIARRLMETVRKNNRILSVAGCGNNGGDALAAARILLEEGYSVDFTVVGDLSQASADLKTQYDILARLGYEQKEEIDYKDYDWILEGLFGVGRSERYRGHTVLLWKGLMEAELKSCQSIFPPESAGIREKSLDAP